MTPETQPAQSVPTTVAVPTPRAVDRPLGEVAHEVRIQDGRFALAVCSCGWHGHGRRNRATARAEAHDHALLYADARSLVTGSDPTS